MIPVPAVECLAPLTQAPGDRLPAVRVQALGALERRLGTNLNVSEADVERDPARALRTFEAYLKKERVGP